MSTSVSTGPTPPYYDARATARSAGSGYLTAEPGTWVFILGDLLVFGAYFLLYLYSRGQDPDTFTASQRALSPTVGTFYTLLLLVSSLFVVAALRAVRAGRRTLSSRLILAAMGCGLAFLILKVVEYSTKVDQGVVPTTNSFFMYFFVLTGLHLFHLIVGLGLLTMVFALVRRTETTGRTTWIESGCCIWHLIDLLWIVIFPLLYFVR